MDGFIEVLYKKDTKKKIRKLIIATSEEGHLIQMSGLLDGKMVEHKKMCKPKNVGKANETTSQQQAILEAKSKVSSKMDEGYFLSVEEAENNLVILPMLAKEFTKEFKKVRFPFHGQKKLDGMRCLAIIKNGVVQLISRKGKVLVTLKHLQMELEQLPKDLEIVLDGEVYAHGDDFQRNMELVKKYRKGQTELLKFHVYDIVEETLPFADRNVLLQGFLSKYNFEHIMGVETVEIKSIEEFREYHLDNVGEGYEGTMVRWGNEGYKMNGRSSHLLKHKDFIDITLPLMDVIPNDSDPTHGTPIFEWESAEDGYFKAGTRLSHDLRKDLLKNKDKYIGLPVELRFPEYYNTGVPRFPVMVGFREDK